MIITFIAFIVIYMVIVIVHTVGLVLILTLKKPTSHTLSIAIISNKWSI